MAEPYKEAAQMSAKGRERTMNKTHDGHVEVALSREEQRAHIHNDRHHVHAELHEITEAVNHGVDPIDLIEPAPIYKVQHHTEEHIGGNPRIDVGGFLRRGSGDKK